MTKVIASTLIALSLLAAAGGAANAGDFNPSTFFADQSRDGP